MIAALILLAVAVLLSAFFSGSETGLYRVSRVRLVLDGMAGDWIARGLLWLTNHPSMFVATVLVGNNIANYMASLAVVLGSHALFGGQAHWPELVGPIAMAPFIFVYGELVPKQLFYHAPYRLLHKSGPALLACAWLFAPLTGLLWGMSKLLQLMVGELPQRVQLTLARRELQRVFEEGHEAGILQATQRSLAQGLFGLANRPVREFATPAARVARVHPGMSKAEIQRLARRQRLPSLPVEESTPTRGLVGYLRMIDLYLQEDGELPIRPLVELPETDSYIVALMRLQRSGETMGQIVDAQGKTVGFVTSRQLSQPLFQIQ
jgi:CBS domain containing-hemolysin-like protein